MRYYPIFLDLRGRDVLVIGGGKVAERKVRKLLRAGARVRVISPELTLGLERLRSRKKVRLTRRRYRQGDIRVGAHRNAPLLVFAATNDPTAQRAVQKDAAGALLNRADDPAGCNFIVPASFTRGSLQVAISTSATNPALARTLRQMLEGEIKKIKGQKAKGKRKNRNSKIEIRKLAG